MDKNLTLLVFSLVAFSSPLAYSGDSFITDLSSIAMDSDADKEEVAKKLIKDKVEEKVETKIESTTNMVGQANVSIDDKKIDVELKDGNKVSTDDMDSIVNTSKNVLTDKLMSK